MAMIVTLPFVFEFDQGGLGRYVKADDKVDKASAQHRGGGGW